MSFRKRNAVISTSAASQAAAPKPDNTPVPGVRPSPHDSRPTTSTGTASLDNLLAGHAGLPLGTSLLIEEHGTTDFAGVLLRYYAAEGLVQGHQVHVLGLYEGWKAELPGLSTDAASSSSSSSSSSSTKSEAPPAGEKMKIAWRYETMGAPRSRSIPQRTSGGPNGTASAATFCHSFDLAKRLAPGDIKGQISFYPTMSPPPPRLTPSSPTTSSFPSTSSSQQQQQQQQKQPPSPFKLFISQLASKLASSPPSEVHRVLVPNLLSPTAYAGAACRPEEVLQFLHALRALLRRHAGRLAALATLPLALFPRAAGLTRWMELLSDGVLELVPLRSDSLVSGPSPGANNNNQKTKSADGRDDEGKKIQGLLKIHSLPIFDEKGGGSPEARAARCEDQAFGLSRSRGLVIRPFSLPPVLDDNDDNNDGKEKVKGGSKKKTSNMEF